MGRLDVGDQGQEPFGDVEMPLLRFVLFGESCSYRRVALVGPGKGEKLGVSLVRLIASVADAFTACSLYIVDLVCLAIFLAPFHLLVSSSPAIV